MTTQLKASQSGIAVIAGWLDGAESQALDDAGLLAELGLRLRAVGLPLDRLVLHLRTLHPEMLARAVVWAPGHPVEVYDRDYGIEFSAEFAGSPVCRVMETGQPLTVYPHRGAGQRWNWPEVFRSHGLTELFIAPLGDNTGPACALSFCTVQSLGFAAAERDALARLIPALGCACVRRYRTD